jgi:hypothetical protein
MRSALLIILGLLAFSITFPSYGQVSNRETVKVAVFVPIYINDAFSGGTFKLGKNSLPKNILPGLEFYNGVMMAIDSLRNEGASAEISIYDTKDNAVFTSVLQGTTLNSTGVIIAALTNTSELRLLANVAKQKNIPLISATYPNSGNVTGNPNVVLLNSTLQAHVEGIYKKLQRNYSIDNIVVVKKFGPIENSLKNLITDLNKNSKSTQLPIKYIDLTDSFSNYQLTRYMDSNRRNVVVVASPYESFGVKIVKTLNTLENYNTVAIGMPTWDGVDEFNRSSLKNVEVVYSTPFNYSRYIGLGATISNEYRSRYKSRPSDMVYKGYESLFHFTKLLIKYKGELLNHLSDNDFTLFNQFNIQPVKLTKESQQPDYQENKKLYFIHKSAGEVISVAPLS